MGQSVDIVIPVYNEKDSIGQALTEIAHHVKIPYQVTIAYDFDEDNTIPVAQKVARELGLNLKLVKNQFGRGALNAIKTGLFASQSEYVVVTMADLSDPASVINQMYEMAQNESADIVCGSRYMRGGSQKGGGLLKSTLSRAAGLSLRYTIRFPTHDITNSFKLYRRKVLQAIRIESTGGFELGMEIVVKARILGFKIGEVPTSWQDRSSGESRFQLLNWLPSYLRWYFLALRSVVPGFKKRAFQNLLT